MYSQINECTHFFMEFSQSLKTLTRILFLILSGFVARESFAEDNYSSPDQAIETSKLNELAIHPKHSAPAIVKSLNTTTLSAEISGRVQKIHIGVSGSVTAGQLLLELDCTDYELNHRQALGRQQIAQAYLKLANSELKRAERLATDSLTSKQRLDTAAADALARNAELNIADAGVQQAAHNIARCKIVAPYTGVITQRIASVGQLATPGTALLTLVDTENIELSAMLPTESLALLSHGSELYFESGERYTVRILHLGNVVDSSSRSQEIRLQFESTSPTAGTAGRLSWKDQRYFVPARFIKQRNGESGIYLIENGKTFFHSLKGTTPGRNHPVLLPPDTLIVTAGFPGSTEIVGRY